MQVYIAGKITGDDNYRDKFHRAESDLIVRYQHIPINPAALHPDGWPWVEYLKADIPILLGCEAIALLPDWRESRGARLELEVAKAAGLKLFVLTDDALLPYECDEQTRQLQHLASDIIADIVGANSARHGGHVEWTSRTPQFHLEKVARHAITALANLNQHEAAVAGEGAEAHIHRVIVRGVMAAHKERNTR